MGYSYTSTFTHFACVFVSVCGLFAFAFRWHLNRSTVSMRKVMYVFCLFYLVLLLCERRTRRRCASANLLLSCSLFNCSIRSRISASSQISAKKNRRICCWNIRYYYNYHIVERTWWCFIVFILCIQIGTAHREHLQNFHLRERKKVKTAADWARLKSSNKQIWTESEYLRVPSRLLHVPVSINLCRRHQQPHDSRARIRQLLSSHLPTQYASETWWKKIEGVAMEWAVETLTGVAPCRSGTSMSPPRSAISCKSRNIWFSVDARVSSISSCVTPRRDISASMQSSVSSSSHKSYGMFPSTLTANKLAPRLINSFTKYKWPHVAAACNGVHFSLSWAFTLAP